MPIEKILLITMFFSISTLGIGWLAIDLVSKRRPSLVQNWLSILLAGLIISNISIQAAWLATGNWMGFETFGTGVREIFLLKSDRDILIVTIITTCCVLLLASLTKRSIVYRRKRSVRKKYAGTLRSPYIVGKSPEESLEHAYHDE